MRREMYLFVAALLFVAGNLTAARLPAAAIFAGTVLTAIMTLSVPGLRKAIPLLFFFMGAWGAALGPAMNCRRERPAPENGVYGIITTGGRSSSGRPFIEVDISGASTIIYNIPDSLRWMPGDTVIAGVRCARVKNFSDDFDYQGYMAERGIFFTCFYGQDSELSVSRCRRPPLRLLPAWMRQKFSEAVDSAMPGDGKARTRAVVKALAYGYQDEIPENIQESFRQSGAVHLLALSGMHLSMLYGFISALLSLLGNSPAVRRIRSVATILLLWAYTIFTGCGASILRAAVMLTIYETGALLGRKRCGISSLALSAIIITVADYRAPSGISFQLSYAAMCAIFLIFPHLRSIVRTRNRIAGNIADVCAMTIACQITTAPVIYLHFGTFAFFSLLANLLCTPLTSAAMALIPLSFFSESRLLTYVIELFIRINATISHL
ncbi:MAG TPA: ComEC family competence protein [Candidatus Coprenecus stercoravium]|uniref:ComEC family competence protein n=1 Tax=Candidatus Coprenecus stercoravium TaxID=2840735 RepID=A0A9D2GMZ2_9BACT|nr:ComEC family competence protein [Candidatus Coprenecus stercoravium]